VPYVKDLHDIEQADHPLVGGKAASLGALSRMGDVRVPPGFCVTTEAYDRVVAGDPAVDGLLDALERLGPDAGDHLRTTAARLRQAVEALAVPAEVERAIVEAVARHGAQAAYAVRSSATAEDLPTASFAGQQDSFLDVAGTDAVLAHVRRCWASLFTERAVAYRRRQAFGHRQVRMAVVVQRMVPARASGVLFTADPVNGNRRVTSIEATPGLGDALVSGQVAPDVVTLRDGRVVSRSPGAEAAATGAPPVLADDRATELAELGRRVAARFGRPQDVEWCLDDEGFAIVQSRPITTLFPIPEAGDDAPHVYISVGHQQMMTDAFKPLGLSLWQRTTPRPMGEAGSRLFVDVAGLLASPANRPGFIAAFSALDPLIGGALQEVADRGFVPPAAEDDTALPPGLAPVEPLDPDPAIVPELIAQAQASLEETERRIAAASGPAALEAIAEDVERTRAEAFKARGLHVIKVAMDAAAWLNEHVETWLGERNVADVLTQSVPHNVTSEMGLALLDVADVARPHAEVVAFLERVEAEGFDDGAFLDALAERPGGREVRDALAAFLERYGMRCVGEIDVSRPRWAERPTALVPAILTNVRSFTAGEAKRRFERGRREALAKRADVLARLRALPDGEDKAREAELMIDRVRTFAGYREHPKYAMVSRYYVYKKAIMAEADRLVASGVLSDRDDVLFLRLEEIDAVLRDGRVDDALLAARKATYREHEALTPPRVLTSEGEMVTGAYRRDGLPDGALPGLAVSAGTVEGRARVAFDIGSAELEPGDILVTPFTDPSWTPVFVAAGGLVTEVGGLMTHGAVVAREYGLPAVVGVERATRLIRDGQRIRVHGTDGYVELLS
jgi:pyruvate,water dikinase